MKEEEAFACILKDEWKFIRGRVGEGVALSRECLGVWPSLTLSGAQRGNGMETEILAKILGVDPMSQELPTQQSIPIA